MRRRPSLDGRTLGRWPPTRFGGGGGGPAAGKRANYSRLGFMAAAAISRQGPGPIKLLHAERELAQSPSHQIPNQRPAAAHHQNQSNLCICMACLRQWTEANFIILHA